MKALATLMVLGALVAPLTASVSVPTANADHYDFSKFKDKTPTRKADCIMLNCLVSRLSMKIKNRGQIADRIGNLFCVEPQCKLNTRMA